MNIPVTEYYHLKNACHEAMAERDDIQQQFKNLMREYVAMEALLNREIELTTKQLKEIDALKQLLRDHGIDSLKARAS